jgi:hypothetical protein
VYCFRVFFTCALCYLNGRALSPLPAEAEHLATFASQPYPDFGVPTGYLTPHGAQAEILLGTYFRTYLLNADRIIIIITLGVIIVLTTWPDNMLPYAIASILGIVLGGCIRGLITREHNNG